jgi:hypothetical protein
MISVIICSRKKTLAEVLVKNIEHTIGVNHEIIVHDNSFLNAGICSVYNQEGSKAKYPVLIFVHEDVLFHTTGWGQIISGHLQDHETGVVGVAGGDSFSSVPSTWSNSFKSNSIHILQHKKKGTGPTLIDLPAGRSSIKSQVVTVDGVFLCVRKSTFDSYKFDESVLKGFHGYDVDFSLLLSQNFKNYVVYDILIEHFSPGCLNLDWMETTFILAKKWKTHLPVSVFNLDKKQQRQFHWQSVHVLIKNLFELRYHPAITYFHCLQYSFGKYFTPRRFISMNRFFSRLLVKYHLNRKYDSMNKSVSLSTLELGNKI